MKYHLDNDNFFDAVNTAILCEKIKSIVDEDLYAASPVSSYCQPYLNQLGYLNPPKITTPLLTTKLNQPITISWEPQGLSTTYEIFMNDSPYFGDIYDSGHLIKKSPTTNTYIFTPTDPTITQYYFTVRTKYNNLSIDDTSNLTLYSAFSYPPGRIDIQ